MKIADTPFPKDLYKFVFTLVSVLFLSAAPALTQICQRPALLGSVALQRDGVMVYVSGTRAYVSTQGGGPEIYDVSNPAAPQLLGWTSQNVGAGNDIFVSGNFAYLAVWGSYPLLIVDVADPAHLQTLARFQLPFPSTGATSVFVTGNIAYLTTNNGLNMIDVSDPANPVLVGRFDVTQYGSPSDVYVSDGNAYLCCSGRGLLIVDVSNVQAPTLKGFLRVDGISNVGVSGNMAYATCGQDLFQVVDVTDPAHPALVGSGKLHQGGSSDIRISGNSAFVISTTPLGTSLQRIDVSDPRNPKRLGSYETVARSGRMFTVCDKVYLIGGPASRPSLSIIDYTSLPMPLYRYQLSGLASALAADVSGNKAYIVGKGKSGYGTLEIVDITSPGNPVYLGSSGPDLQERGADVCVSGNIAYVAGRHNSSAGLLAGFTALDVSVAAGPTLVGSYSSTRSPAAETVLRLSGSFAYLNTAGGLEIVDVSSASNPTLLGSYEVAASTPITDFQVVGDKVYVILQGTGLLVLDVSNPQAPQSLLQYPLTNPLKISVSGITAYVVSNGVLQCLNVSDPLHPTSIGKWSIILGTPTGIQVLGNVAYITSRAPYATSAASLQLIDVSNVANPVRLGAYEPLANDPGAIYSKSALLDGKAYLPGGDVPNLTVVDVAPCVTVTCSGIQGTVTANGNGFAGVTVRLLDANGVPVPSVGPVTTNNQGIYSFAMVEPGAYQVMITEPPDYVTDQNPKLVTVIPGQVFTVSFILSRATGTIAVAVTVGDLGMSTVAVALQNQNGTPVPGFDTQQTDGTGHCQFNNVPIGDYQVQVTPPTGYSVDQNQKQVTVQARLTSTVTFLLTPLFTSETATSITADFNGTVIPPGSTIWFSSVFKASGVKADAVNLYVLKSTITYTLNGVTTTLSAPATHLGFDPNATEAATSFAGGAWEIVVPAGMGKNIFLSGLAQPIDGAGLPGGIKDVIWALRLGIDKPSVVLKWQWAAAVYSQFGDHSALNVKPIDGDQFNPYANSDHAGTPEAFKQYVIAGARGGGGSNYTGGYSGTLSVAFPAPLPKFGGEDLGAIPARSQLLQNYPNPFNPSTTIWYGLPNAVRVRLAVYNTLGEEVALLVNEMQAAGYHRVQFNAAGLASAIYFYRLQAGSYVETRKLLVTK